MLQAERTGGALDDGGEEGNARLESKEAIQRGFFIFFVRDLDLLREGA